MNNYLNGFDRQEVTFKANSTIRQGATAKLISASMVGLASVGSDFIGVCSLVRDDAASIVMRGYVQVAFTGTAPSVGFNKLTADGEGGVKVDANGRHFLVADVDKINSTCGIIIN